MRTLAVSVTTSKTQVLPAESADTSNRPRRTVSLLNYGAADCVVYGSATTTFADGFPLLANGGGIVLSEDIAGEINARTSTGTTDLRVLVEEG